MSDCLYIFLSTYVLIYVCLHAHQSVCLSVHLSINAVHASVECVSLIYFVQRKDLLQLMLDASQASGSQLEEGHVLINAMGILLAGHDTTSSALSFASYLLAVNPEVQEKLAEEISSYLLENPVSSVSV